jgi:hypothetical protein
MMKLRIKVTKSHIDVGRLGSPDYCPIGVAVNSEIYEGYYAYILEEEIMVINRSEEKYDSCVGVIPLPRSARRFIARFDKGLTVKPFSFDLVVPE